MVAAPRALLRNLLAALIAAGLMVLAAAMVTPGGDTVRGAGPAIHPAAEITPNALPRDDGAQLAATDGAQLVTADGARPPAPDDDAAPTAGDHAGDHPGDHGATHDAAVVDEPVSTGGDDTRSDRVPDGHAHPAASAPVSTVDGRAPPEPGAV
ncbi:hypothetical protein E1212_25120 [Jiangella ureilytica]|uniref:Uncharacterized protein n=1 Tax=Jiangella ureilytica TaxID=2530374 RepID=A0A4R4RD85_9ACTN|nr:hypothetical protein [Jiangella ureilytica]TDC47137.1 hypothetical protein E1212_25120 [Jiangella ureilytica]